MADTALDAFTRGYIECALWVETDDDEMSLSRNYEGSDIDTLDLELMIADCARFQEENADDLNGPDAGGRAGHDFWLTRNHHGCGFWDGDWPDTIRIPERLSIADRLTEAAQAFGDASLVVGIGGVIYHEPPSSENASRNRQAYEGREKWEAKVGRAAWAPGEWKTMRRRRPVAPRVIRDAETQPDRGGE